MRFLIVLLFCACVQGQTNFYVDNTLGADCVGNYSIANRACNGSDGDAWNTIGEGIDNLGDNETMNIRAGTYEHNATDVTQFVGTIGKGTGGGVFSPPSTIRGYASELVTITNAFIHEIVFSTHQEIGNLTISHLTFNIDNRRLANQDSWTNTSGNRWTTSAQAGNRQIDIVQRKSGGNWLIPTIGESASVAAMSSDGDWFQDGASLGTINGFFTSNPNSRDNWSQVSNRGLTIGRPSSQNGLITIHDNVFINGGHATIKGAYQFHVFNNEFLGVGATNQHHHVYRVGGTDALGSESIYEYNYFEGAWHGAALHFFDNDGTPGQEPNFQIVRYNIFNSIIPVGGGNFNASAILLDSNNNQVIGNTIASNGGNLRRGIQMDACSSRNDCTDNNTIRNNIFVGTFSDGFPIVFNPQPFPAANNVITHNLTDNSPIANSSACDNCTITDNLLSTSPGFTSSAFDTFDDFRLGSGSAAINAGITLAAAFDTGLDPADITWPPSLLQQAGSWDIGAFLFDGVIIDPTTATLGGGATEQEIRDGGQQLIVTLAADTWVAAGATFDAQRQFIINGLTSAQGELLGWNNEVRGNMLVGEVVRTNSVTVTITITAKAAYDITSLENIVMTVPADALVISTVAVAAVPSITIVTVPDVPGDTLSMLFEGIVTSIIDADSFLTASTLEIQLGDVVTGSFCYTTTSIDRDSTDEWGDYRFNSSPDSMSLTIEGNVWQPTTRFALQTLIRNGSSGDMFAVSLRGIDMPSDLESSENPNHSFMQLSLVDTDATVFIDGTLPSTALTLSDFELGTVEIVVTHNSATGAYYRILAETVSTLVEP